MTALARRTVSALVVAALGGAFVSAAAVAAPEPPAVAEETVAPAPVASGSEEDGRAAATAAAYVARPGAATTGVVAGRTLSPLAAGTVSASGTVADRVVTGDVTFTGSDLTVRNVRVTGHVLFTGQNVVVEDSEFGSMALSGARNVRISRVEVFGNPGQDGIHITSDRGRVRDVVVEDTWIHDPKVTADSHYDGIQVRGVDRLTLRRLSIDLGPFAPQHNAALFLENANGGNSVVRVEDSWLLGGGYVLYSFGTQVSVRDSVLGQGNWGVFFPSSWLAEVVEFSGNRDAAGAALSLGTGSGTSSGTGSGTSSGPSADAARSSRDRRFVVALYQDFLGRGPSETELATWVGRLDAGASRFDVAMELARTDHWITAVVTRFYRDTLGRAPDAHGLTTWVQAAREGRPMESIAASFYASDEYLSKVARGDLRVWVTDLYAKLLFRSPDSRGLENWLAVLRAGKGRHAVALGFYQADETSRLRVESLYQTLLGRRADASGLRTWPPVVRAQGDLVLAAFLASSDEYYDKAQRR